MSGAAIGLRYRRAMSGSAPDQDAAQRLRLRALLGLDATPRFIPAARQLALETLDGFVLERLEFEGASGEAVPALLARPRRDATGAAVIYCHAHGNNYAIGKDELIAGRRALRGAYAGDLARRGIAALCIDLPTFGARAVPGESALAKALLWRGETLFGRMLGDLTAACDWLAMRPDIDAARIGAMGLSMGATLAWWLAAIEPRIAAVAELCCFADLATLVDSGAHDLHGIYMTVPGLLREFATGEIAALIAPRPHLACVGLRDPLTPPDAVAIVDATLKARYATLGVPERWTLLADPDCGHVETPAMRAAVLDFLALTLAGRSSR
jgi:dienelactone hydrolase